MKTTNGNAYAWHYDRLAGVGRFERLSDSKLTDWETGQECQIVNDHIEDQFKKYPEKAAKDNLDLLAAGGYEFGY